MPVDYRLNAIVDAQFIGKSSLTQYAALAAAGGATILQYRDKHATTLEMIDTTRALLAAIEKTGVPLVVNDRVDVAMAAGAHGVHLGRDDMHPRDARRLMGEGAIIGVTVKSPQDADHAVSLPVDYACIGGVFATTSKDNPDPPVGLAGLGELARHMRLRRPDLPIGAIAGITLDNTPQVIAAGADGVAAIGALFGHGSVEGAARSLRAAVDAALKVRP